MKTLLSRCNKMLQRSVMLICFLTTITLTAQEILWQKTQGGEQDEYLYSMVSTPDYGYLLAGSTFSSSSGNKSSKSKGDLDYFLWKMDEKGNLEWERSYGGSGSDYLYSVALTSDGGYVLGGSSNSPISGDKKQQNIGGYDYWVLRIDPFGKIIWQKTIGGVGDDQLIILKACKDGGFILGGTSDSSPLYVNDLPVGDKSQKSFGNKDLWIVKITENGDILWEKSYGGKFTDELKSISLTDNGYIVGAISNSPQSGSKVSESLGSFDYWVFEINDEGELLWEKTFGGQEDDILSQIIEVKDGYILAGSSSSSVSENKKSNSLNGSDFWIIKIDKSGNYIWDQSYDFGQYDNLVSINQSKDNLLLGGYSYNDNRFGEGTQIVSDYVALLINENGEMVKSYKIGGEGKDELKSVVQTRDGGFLLAGNSNSRKSNDKDQTNIGGNDFWVVKLGEKNKHDEKRQLVEIYPNPTSQFVNIVITESFEVASFELFDLVGRKMQSKEIKYGTTPVDLQSYPSGVYVFKIIVDNQVQDVKVIKKGNK